LCQSYHLEELTEASPHGIDVTVSLVFIEPILTVIDAVTVLKVEHELTVSVDLK
jgi:hypothetical protein